MRIKTFSNNSMGQNVYLVWCSETKEGVLVDVGCNAVDEKNIMGIIAKEEIEIKAILLTHGHYDHMIGLERMKTLLDVPVYCHAKEAEFLENPDLNLSYLTSQKISVSADRLFADGDLFTFGNCEFKVLHTPGHTPGCICFYSTQNEALFVGDTLFKGSIGRTDFPLGDHEKMIKNIKVKLLALPEKTNVYAGHGESTTIGREKVSNPFL